MAKSFHDIINDGTLEVNHQGETVELELPQVLADLKGILMDKEMLLHWMTENDIDLGVIHAGIQKLIIDVRATARPATNAKTGESPSIVTNKMAAQLRVDGWKIEATKPPGQSKTKAFGKGEEAAIKATVEAMKMAAMSNEQIVSILGAKFDQGKIRLVLEGLELEKN